ncbi:MAG: hypothetical protein ACHQRM_00050 [Bacteroidia bacterium]
MERINRDNYEVWFLDYHEGVLSAEQVAELLLFLEQHPDLKEIFEEFEIIPITLNKEGDPDKESLKQALVDAGNYEEYMIGSVEGMLDEEDTLELKKFLNKHPEYQRDMDLFNMTVFKPDLTDVCPFKEELKKREYKIIPLRFNPWMAAAAALALLIGIWMFNRNETITVESVAIIDTTKQPDKTINNNGHQSAPVQERVAINRTNSNTSKHRIERVPEQVLHTTTLSTLEARTIETNLVAESTPDLKMKELPDVIHTPETAPVVKAFYPDIKSLAREQLTTLTGTERPAKGRRHAGWELCKIAVRGYNRISSRKIKIKEEYNNQGMLVSYALQSKDMTYEQQTNN